MNIINVPIEKIKTSLVIRKRGGLDIDGMMRSIESHGLLHPIGLTSDYELVYGWRRFQACELLKMDTIPAVFIRKEHLRYQVMKTENNLRKELTSEEQVLLAQKLEEEGHKNAPAFWRSLGVVRDDPEDQIETGKGESGSDSQVCPNWDKPDFCDNKYPRIDDAVAKAVGLGSKNKYRKAETVVNKGSRFLIDAMNQNKISIDAAYQLSKLPEEEQTAIDYDNKQAVKEKVRQIRKPPKRANMNKPEIIKPEIASVLALTRDWPENQLLALIDMLQQQVKDNSEGK